MFIKDLITGLKCQLLNDKDGIIIENLSIDSRKCTKGSLFCCIEGAKVDAHNFAKDAIKQGAVALVVSKKLDLDIVQILVDDVRKALAIICSNFYDNVDKKMHFVGVTGTNGKTTTTHIIRHILEASGKSVGLIGTNGCIIGKELIKTNLTTPDTIDLFDILKRMHSKGVEYVVMEVSAHAIALDKIYGIRFDVGVFTNLTQDHLDFFGDMDTYWSVKKHFISNYADKIVVNVDDLRGQELKDLANVYKYGLDFPSDAFAVNVDSSFDGLKAYLNIEDNVFDIHFSLPGLYNIYNVLAGAYTSFLLGCSIEDIQRGLQEIQCIDGRCEMIPVKDFTVVLDYAHTPDALEKILSTLKDLCKGRLIVIFGASGYRDSGKRATMGQVVSRLSDFSIITSDNPRYENPRDIIRSIELGYTNNQYIVEVDRAIAIKMGLDIARQDDIVAICGKGREMSQNINGVDIPYSDYEQVQLYINNMNIK